MELDLAVVEEDLVFRGTEFAVKVEVEKALLNVEISDSATADQWRGEFDPAYIEDLTRKTGNFKQFPIFCSMLESAVKKTSDSVTLDLLTYGDLELLRNRKTGDGGRADGGCAAGRQQCPTLSAKRYLILIYTVEFDRIHYPLPLPYQGKPDPAVLQREIRALRRELCVLGSHGTRPEPEIRRLRAELSLVKEALATALEQRQQLDGGPAGDAWRARDTVRTMEEQVSRVRARDTVRTMEEQVSRVRARDNVRTMEEQVSRERAKSQEHRRLMEQLKELRSSECALQIRVKTLTNELALLRRGRVTPVSCGRGGGSRPDGEIQRSLSRERMLGHVGAARARSGSRERMEERRRRTDERGARAGSSGPQAHIPRRSPSPTGPCFDPTAYIQDRQRRQKEAELKTQRKVRRDMLASPILLERGRSRSREVYPHSRSGSNGRGRSVSVERRGSRPSSASSQGDMDETARGRKQNCNGPTVPRGRLVTRKPVCSTPTTHRTRADKESSTCPDLTEIDARLQALQDYMRDLDTGH